GVPWNTNKPLAQCTGVKSSTALIGGEGRSPRPIPSKKSIGAMAATSAGVRVPGAASWLRTACSSAIQVARRASRDKWGIRAPNKYDGRHVIIHIMVEI